MSRYNSREVSEGKVYIGNLPRDTTERDIETTFDRYGKLKNVWVARNPPGFAFVEYDDSRDAQDAIKGLDGSSLNGARIRVERATGGTRNKNRGRDGGRESGRREYNRKESPRRRFSPRRDKRDDRSDDEYRRSDSNGRESCRRERPARRTPSPHKSRSRSRSPVSRNRSRSRS